MGVKEEKAERLKGERREGLGGGGDTKERAIRWKRGKE
jgi:hypothetical protein